MPDLHRVTACLKESQLICACSCSCVVLLRLPQKAFPQFYLYDPTPVHLATWRVGRDCTAAVQRPTGEWVFVQSEGAATA